MEAQISHKFFFEDLIYKIKNYKLSLEDQKKPGSEIKKIINDAHREITKDCIRNILNKEFSQEIKAELLYNQWLEDMADVCKTFCELEKIEAVSFQLGTQRACRRYHIDNVPKRMLVTYAG